MNFIDPFRIPPISKEQSISLPQKRRDEMANAYRSIINSPIHRNSGFLHVYVILTTRIRLSHGKSNTPQKKRKNRSKRNPTSKKRRIVNTKTSALAARLKPSEPVMNAEYPFAMDAVLMEIYVIIVSRIS